MQKNYSFILHFIGNIFLKKFESCDSESKKNEKEENYAKLEKWHGPIFFEKIIYVFRQFVLNRMKKIWEIEILKNYTQERSN